MSKGPKLVPDDEAPGFHTLREMTYLFAAPYRSKTDPFADAIEQVLLAKPELANLPVNHPDAVAIIKAARKYAKGE